MAIDNANQLFVEYYYMILEYYSGKLGEFRMNKQCLERKSNGR